MICLEFVFSMGQVHKSYYLSKMPQPVREKELRKPLMSWQRSEIMGNDNSMTFADAHGEVDHLFFHVVVLPVFCVTMNIECEIIPRSSCWIRQHRPLSSMCTLGAACDELLSARFSCKYASWYAIIL